MPTAENSTGRFIDDLRDKATEALDRLHRDITEIVCTDFPDHHNVGDAAIGLGQLAFWRSAGIRVRETHSWLTIDRGVYDSSTPVAITGGGNLGGLYAAHADHRYTLAQELSTGTPLIQEPQSIHFVSAVDRDQFDRLLARRPGFRLAVRDTTSLDLVRDLVPDVILSPDCVHVLGAIEAPAPVSEHVYLLRRDDESRLPTGHPADAVDWHQYTFPERVARRVARVVSEGSILRTSTRATARWEADARRRVARGVTLLSRGETIVTDRLHAMLLGLQMGRRVIAIDNANGKLTSYARTWLLDTDAPLEFADDLEQAAAMVGGRPHPVDRAVIGPR